MPQLPMNKAMFDSCFRSPPAAKASLPMLTVATAQLQAASHARCEACCNAGR
jgi:hypothetical protein